MCTENLDLKPRPLEKRDLPLLVAWANNTALSRVPYIEASGTLKGAEIWFAGVSESKYRKDFVFEKDKKVRAIGGLSAIDLDEKTAEIYMFVYPSLMNLGVSTEVVRLLCSYGFEKLELNRINLVIKLDDLVAIMAYEKFGFCTEEPISRISLPSDYERPLYYSLRRRFWEEDHLFEPSPWWFT